MVNMTTWEDTKTTSEISKFIADKGLSEEEIQLLYQLFGQEAP